MLRTNMFGASFFPVEEEAYFKVHTYIFFHSILFFYEIEALRLHASIFESMLGRKKALSMFGVFHQTRSRRSVEV